jgi:4-hydroxythreonine-4-phosphate dehydrogenase
MPTVASQSSSAHTQRRTDRFAVVADDLTGAADTGVAFLSAGLSVVVGWTDDVVRADADVVAVSTGSRAMSQDAARARTTAAVDACRRAGASILYKKIDSLLRGHVGLEIAAVRSAWDGGGLAIVAPAFPATGRTTIDGRLVVSDARAAGDGLSIVDLLARDGLSVASIDLTVVRGRTLKDALGHERSRGVACVVCDAESDADLRAIAEAGRALGPGVIWIGSGGLAHAIAAMLPAAPSRATLDASTQGARLFVIGSRSPIAREQAAALVDDGVRRIVVPADRLAADVSAIADEWAIDAAHTLERGEDVIVTAAEGATHVDDDAALMTRLGQALRACAAFAGGLVVTGGDTAVGVLSAWGISGLRLTDELEPGIVLSSAIGPRALPIVTKSGSFGDRGALVRARRRLRKEA